MTETEKAREWLRTWDRVFKYHEDLVVELLAAYGAAQYEAGATQMRTRAVKWAQETDLPLPIEAFIGTKKELCGKVCLALANELRALPLREKD